MRNCEFLSDDTHFVTCGGQDCAIILWAFEARADAEGAGVIDPRKGGGQLYGSDPDVKTVQMTEGDRLRHPDLRDGSRYAAIASKFAYRHNLYSLAVAAMILILSGVLVTTTNARTRRPLL